MANKRKSRKGEQRLTRLVDGEGRHAAETLINTEVSQLLNDLSELIAAAVRRNPDNPISELTIDAVSRRQVSDILTKLIDGFDTANLSQGARDAKKSARRRAASTSRLTRLDVCYLANLSGVSGRYRRKLTTLLNAVKDGIRAPWNVDGGSAAPSTSNRRYVPRIKATSKAPSDVQVRELAKKLNGKSLRTKCLNVVEQRLLTMPDSEDTMKSYKMFLGENAVRFTNAIQSTLRQGMDVALSTIKGNPAVSAAELQDEVYRAMAPAFGSAKNAAKVASRGTVSGVLNMAIVDEVERLVNIGAIPNEAFLLNKPGFLYKAVMDLRTSDICRTLNGLIIPLSDRHRLARFMPPQHANCRSVLIPNLRP